MPITACPCPLTATDGIQYDVAPPPPSKIVPDRERVGVELRFASSYHRTASRVGAADPVPIASMPMACAV